MACLISHESDAFQHGRVLGALFLLFALSPEVTLELIFPESYLTLPSFNIASALVEMG